MTSPCAPGSGVTINMFEDGTPIPDFDRPGPEVTVSLYNAAGSTVDVCLRRLANASNLAGGYEWYGLDGTAKAEPADAANYTNASHCCAYFVAYAEGPGVTPDNSQTWLTLWGITGPVDVWVIDGPSGGSEKWSIQDDTNGAPQWHQSA